MSQTPDNGSLVYPLLRQLEEGKGWLRAASLLSVPILDLRCHVVKQLRRIKQKMHKPKLAYPKAIFKQVY